jgi:hypothetical protein
MSHDEANKKLKAIPLSKIHGPKECMGAPQVMPALYWNSSYVEL